MYFVHIDYSKCDECFDHDTPLCEKAWEGFKLLHGGRDFVSKLNASDEKKREQSELAKIQCPLKAIVFTDAADKRM